MIQKMPVEFNQLNLKRDVGRLALRMLAVQFKQKKKHWISGEIFCGEQFCPSQTQR